MSPFLRAVFFGALAGGTGDLLFALGFAAFRGTPPLTLLQIVASGAFGEAALSGGLAMSAAGLVGHSVLSLGWAALLVVLYRRLGTRPLSFAIVAGLGVFVLMRLVVLPLSAYPYPVTFAPLPTMLDAASHVFLFAWPIALVARRTGAVTTR